MISGAPHPRFETLTATRPVKAEPMLFDVRLEIRPDAEDPDGSQRLGLFLKAAKRAWEIGCVTARRVKNST